MQYNAHAETQYLYLGTSAATSQTAYSVAVPYPSQDAAVFSTSRMVNAGRNANGAMVGQMVGRPIDKQQLGWQRIEREKWWELQRFFTDGNFIFYCCYFDHSTGLWRTRRFYLGDVQATPVKVGADGKPLYYRDAKCNIIDCGE